eukprot:3125539-Prymnesium_polylepis.1
MPTPLELGCSAMCPPRGRVMLTDGHSRSEARASSPRSSDTLTAAAAQIRPAVLMLDTRRARTRKP